MERSKNVPWLSGRLSKRFEMKKATFTAMCVGYDERVIINVIDVNAFIHADPDDIVVILVGGIDRQELQTTEKRNLVDIELYPTDLK